MIFLFLAVLSPEVLELSGIAGQHLSIDLHTTQPAYLEAQYPLEVHADSLRIHKDTQPGFYELTVYAVEHSDSAIHQAIGIPTRLRVEEIRTYKTPSRWSIRRVLRWIRELLS